MTNRVTYIISNQNFLPLSEQELQVYRNVSLEYATVLCPIGLCFIAMWQDAICQLAFVDSPQHENEYLNQICHLWQINQYKKRPEKVLQKVESFFATENYFWQGLVQASPFEKKIWQALIKIPYGQTMSYLDLAKTITPENYKNFSRAVGGAVGRNLLGYLIPCHRVLYKNGSIGNYRYGTHHKQKLLAWETLKKKQT